MLAVGRTREDTVRQIVGSLTGDAEGCSDLANELSRADPVTLETQDSEDEGSDPEEWTPDPTDALTGQWQVTLRTLFSLVMPCGKRLE